MYLGFLMNLPGVNAFKSYPPEAKVLWVLWLTLPRFQGAYRIYTLLLKCFYEKYEDDIDSKVSEISGSLRAKVWQKMKMMFYILFLSSNDGLIGNILGQQESKPDMRYEMLKFVQSSYSTVTGYGSKRKSPKPKKKGMGAMKDRLLRDFTYLLTDEGIWLEAGSTSGAIDSGSDQVEMSVFLLKLNGDVIYFEYCDDATLNFSIRLKDICSVTSCLEPINAGSSEKSSLLLVASSETDVMGTYLYLRAGEGDREENSSLLAGLRLLGGV